MKRGAIEKPNTEKFPQMNRRTFFKAGIATLGTLIGVGYLGSALAFLWPASARAAKLENVGALDDFAPETATLVTYHASSGTPEGVYIVNTAGKLLALDFHCTHLECAINWSPDLKQFLCPCHGSVFNIEGVNLAGPAPRPLYRRVLQVKGERVLIGGRII